MMTRPTYRILAAAGISIYILITALTALHYNYPYDQTLERLAATAESQGPFKLDFAPPERQLPFAIRVPRVNVGLALPEGILPLLKLEPVDLSLRTWAVLLGQIRVKVTGGGESQNLHGQMVMGLFGNSGLRVQLDRIDLPQFVFTDPTGKTSVTGRLTGSIIAEGNNKTFPENGQGRLVLESARITGLNLPYLPIRDFDFDRIEIEFDFEKTDVTVKKLIAQGPQTEMNLTGRIRNYLHPSMDLSGSARLGPENSPLATATFRLTGSVANPKVTITSGKGISLPFPGVSDTHQ